MEVLLNYAVTGLIAGISAFLGVKLDIERLKIRVHYIERKVGLDP